MIPIGFDHFFLIVNAATFVTLAGYWARASWLAVADEWNLSQESLCRCPKCRHTFIAQRGENAAPCPSCREPIKIRLKKAAKRLRY